MLRKHASLSPREAQRRSASRVTLAQSVSSSFRSIHVSHPPLMIAESHDTITEAWIAGTERLIGARGDAFTSILEVRQPGEPRGLDLPARLLLDDVLMRSNRMDTETVANTIFPHVMARHRTAEALYERYLTRTYPRIRRLKGNKRGTYFQRLIYHRGIDRRGRIKESNPLADVITKMRGALAEPRTLRSAYELAVYRPSLDARVRMAFPCLSHLSLKLEPSSRLLHLSAFYRNQYYIQRAYGNLLGLARLQAFIARELNINVGALVCHATHAHLDVSIRSARALLAAMNQTLAKSQSLPLVVQVSQLAGD